MLLSTPKRNASGYRMELTQQEALWLIERLAAGVVHAQKCSHSSFSSAVYVETKDDAFEGNVIHFTVSGEGGAQ